MNKTKIEELKEQVNDLEQELEEKQERKDKIENNDCEDEYDEMLDQEGEINIGNLSYIASEVLQKIDPIAYSCGYNEYFDEELSELENDIDDLEEQIKTLNLEISTLELREVKA